MTKAMRYDGGVLCYCLTMSKNAKENLIAKGINEDLETLLSNKVTFNAVINRLNEEWKGKAEIKEVRLVGHYLMVKISYYKKQNNYKTDFNIGEEDFKKQISNTLVEAFKLPLEKSFLEFDEIDGFYWNESEKRLYVI